MAGINPRVDIAFKKLFGVEENKDLLISLINAIVSDEDQVVNVKLLNPYNPKSFQTDKLSILDIKAEGETGKRYNIEIQITDESDYDKRALYYWAKLYTEQLKESDRYDKLSKSIGIHILNFTSVPELKPYHNTFHITDKDTGLHAFTDLELHTIELTKFSDQAPKTLQELVTKIKSKLDLWVAFLTRYDILSDQDLPKEIDNPPLKKALSTLNIMNFDEEEREAYENHLKWLRIEASTLHKRFEDGKSEGREEGIEIGEARGREEEKLLSEKKMHIIAKNLQAQGMDRETIAKIMELSMEDIS